MNWNVTGTATILAASPTDNGLLLAAYSQKLTPNLETGTIDKSRLLFHITYMGKRLEELAPRLVKDVRVAFEGSFTGSEKGNPIIMTTKDGAPYTVFSVLASDVRILGKLTKKDKDEDEYEDLTTVVISGNLGRDGELQFIPSGEMVCHASLAVNRKTYNEDTKQYDTETLWWRLNLWGDRAEKAADMWKKGVKLNVKLLLRADKQTGAPPIWINRDGLPSASYEGTVLTWEFAQKKSDGNGAPVPPQERPVEEEDQVPF